MPYTNIKSLQLFMQTSSNYLILRASPEIIKNYEGVRKVLQNFFGSSHFRIL